MPNLAEIGSHVKEVREEQKQRLASISSGREIFFQGDGDLANMAIVPSGKSKESDTETRLLDYYVHNEQVTPTSPNDKGYRFYFCTLAVTEECEHCDRNVYKQYRFAFWAYVYNRRIKATPQNTDNWEQVQTASGETMWEQEINDFRVVSLPFGKADMYWKLLLDISYEEKGLNKKAVRVSRSGLGRDTVWGLKTVNEPTVNWKEIGEGVDELPGLNDYFMEREAAKKVIVEDSVALDSDDKEDSTSASTSDKKDAPFDF
jgi:hypothetical protein